jgi:signal transduction histidine kinase
MSPCNGSRKRNCAPPICKLEQRNREVERANRLKSEFLASMSHELRTPLHTIIGFSELLAEGVEGSLNDRQARFVRHVHQDALHLLELINDVLDLSKIEAGRLELQLEPFDSLSVINDALGSIHPMADAKHIVTANRIKGPLPIFADRVRFREILTNLLSNAIKFTPESGNIWIEREPAPEDVVCFSVGDTGIGIARKITMPSSTLSGRSAPPPWSARRNRARPRHCEAPGGNAWRHHSPRE